MQRAYFYLVLTTLLWSGNFIIGRATHADIGPLTLSCGRWLLVTVLLSPWFFKIIKKKTLSPAQWLQLSFLAMIAVGIYNTFIYIGLQYIDAPNGVLYNSTIPFYIICINGLIFKKIIGKRELVGIVLSALGVIILISKGELTTLLQLEFSQGDLWIIVATFCWGLYTALLPYWRPIHLNGLELLSVLATVGVVPLLLARAVNPFGESSFQWVPANVSAVVYVAVAASIISWFFYNESVKQIGAEKAGQSIHLIPVFVSIMAYIFLHESLHGYHLFGAVFIFSGLVVANRLSLFKSVQAR